MLPSFRWRWERKDLNGGHPLIARLAEKVLDVNLRLVGPTSHPVLMPELDWETEGVGSVSSSSSAGGLHHGPHGAHGHGGPGGHQTTPKMSNAYPGSGGYSTGPGTPHSSSAITNSPGATRGGGGPGGGGQHTGVSTPVGADQKLAEVPAGLFYPFYPESTVVGDGGTPGPGAAGPGGGGARGGGPGQGGGGAANGGGSNGTPVGSANGGGGDYTQILAQAAAQQGTGQWGAPSQESYMLEEKDVSMSHHSHSGNMSVHMWPGGAPFTPMGGPGA